MNLDLYLINLGLDETGLGMHAPKCALNVPYKVSPKTRIRYLSLPLPSPPIVMQHAFSHLHRFFFLLSPFPLQLNPPT